MKFPFKIHTTVLYKVLIVMIYYWKIDNKEDIGFNLMTTFCFMVCALGIGSELAEKQTTKIINSQYHPKTKVTIISDSTYHIDTLYYIKVKPKTK
jgi:hypothetical protein